MQAIRDVTLPPLPFYSLRRVYTSTRTRRGQMVVGGQLTLLVAMQRGETKDEIHVT